MIKGPSKRYRTIAKRIASLSDGEVRVLAKRKGRIGEIAAVENMAREEEYTRSLEGMAESMGLSIPQPEHSVHGVHGIPFEY